MSALWEFRFFLFAESMSLPDFIQLLKRSFDVYMFTDFVRDAGKSSRKTGWALFLSHCFKDDRHPDPDHQETWPQRRTRVLKTATARWREQSYEMRCLRNEYSEKAKSMNSIPNLKRKRSQMLLEDIHEKEMDQLRRVEEHQIQLVNLACQHNMICPNERVSTTPSVLRPQALAQFAHQHADDSVVQAKPSDGNVEQLVQFTDADDSETLVNASAIVSQNDESLHGLGDTMFGLSEAILDECLKIEGFTEKSSAQLHTDHSTVCSDYQHFVLDANADIEGVSMKSCRQLCGRYCRKSINNDNIGMFHNIVDMIKSIARLMAAKRNVKNGNTYFLSPSCRLPVLVISTPSSTHARLVCRTCFSPLEVDLMHCQIECQGDDGFKVTLQFSGLDGTNFLCPTTDTMCEFAVWMCTIFECGPGYSCQLFTDYDLDDHHDHVLWLRSSHESATTESPGQSSFQSIIGPKPQKRRVVDEDEAALVVASFLSVLDKDGKHKKTKQLHGTGQPPQSYGPSQWLPSKPNGSWSHSIRLMEKKLCTTCDARNGFETDIKTTFRAS